jgi:hypothetical protein
MDNLNTYNKDEFEPWFKTTEIYKKLKQDYTDDQLVWEKHFFLKDGHYFNPIPWNTTSYWKTPREKHVTKFSATIFYYLLPLLEKNPKTIYDLGCGKNMFKKYLPNIIGVGAEYILANNFFINNYNQIKDESWPTITCYDDFNKLPDKIKTECTLHKLDLTQPSVGLAHFYGDEHGLVDDKYINDHQNYFESVFAICSLHFHPLCDFKKIVLDFASMIQDNGRGFLGINFQRLVDFTSNNFLIEQFGTKYPTREQYDQWVRTELSTTNLKFLILDVNLTPLDDAMDGNIRLLIEK